MPWKRGKEASQNCDLIHQYYMDIINALPDIVYWVDVDCNLLGCNLNFINLLGMHGLNDMKGTPYQQMKKHAHWSDKRIESFKLDDMKVIFSKNPRKNVEEEPVEDEHGHFMYFKSNRIPMYDEQKNLVGLIVVLTDISASKRLETEIITPAAAPDSKVALSIQESHIPMILMIEDNEVAQSVEKALFTGLNCYVDIADSDEQALKLFTPGKYDLVLMDIGLEGTSGYVVAKQLRNMERNTTHHVPIIALTGFEADIVKYDCEEYFMEGAISKPLSDEQAEQIIKHYVYNMDTPVKGLKKA